MSYEQPSVQPLQSRMIFVFAGRTEYFPNFQSTPQSADEMKGGCERVVNTFRIE